MKKSEHAICKAKLNAAWKPARHEATDEETKRVVDSVFRFVGRDGGVDGAFRRAIDLIELGEGCALHPKA
jgi:hypothetical protein